MAVESSLEIYKILLGDRNFEEVIREKNGILVDDKKSQKDLFLLLFKNVLKELTRDKVWTSIHTKLGLALFSRKGEKVNTILTGHSDCNVIEGYVDGGLYDKMRMVAQTNKVSNREVLGRDKIVTDRYYIYMYFPIGSNVGLLFLERKKGSSIHVAVNAFIRTLLKTQGKQVKIERFVPKTIIEQYRDESVVDSFVFSDYMLTPMLDGNGILKEEKQIKVSIKISLADGDRPNYLSLNNILSKLLAGANFILGDNNKRLADFHNKKGTLKKEEKKYIFSIEDNLKIRPAIPIKDEFQDVEKSILVREKIKEMCDDVLAQIKKEIYPIM